ncbi:hypothetical protein AURDEDRAFT_130135 [Auricularia subglabra TFB-10046 SS5]|uniref:Uncharacterized protein n=1 Tax=Auricularia subglabra (strain TFB-10046 / SS5) TaxID=717982 RepID=J0WU64_AURST|nr:hypothetical protein AURDEDRAFT_130135 [Auricularia subglabra TFB-10046 SS5]
MTSTKKQAMSSKRVAHSPQRPAVRLTASQCPQFNMVVGYYDRDEDQFRSVLVPDPQGGHRVGAARQPRRLPIECSRGYPGCRGSGAQACVQKACKGCCTKTRADCRAHAAGRRPPPIPPRRHGRLEISLSIRDQKKSRTTAVVVPGDVFHLALLEREQFQSLEFHEIDAKTLHYYDVAEAIWRPLTQQTLVHLRPTTRQLLLRARSRPQSGPHSFPPRYVCEFSDCYDAYCALIGPDTTPAVAFKKSFTDYCYDPRDFQLALELWSATPHNVQTAFKDAGPTDAGLWEDLVKDGKRRKLAAAAERRRSVAKDEIIVIDDD